MVETLGLANLDLLMVFTDGLEAPPKNNTRNYGSVMPNLL